MTIKYESDPKRSILTGRTACVLALKTLYFGVEVPVCLVRSERSEKRTRRTMVVVQIMVFLLGLGIAVSTLLSAIRQTVLPGRKKVRLSRAVFRNTFRLFRLVIVRIHSDTARDALWAFYAPMSVMLLPLSWVILLMIGLAMMFWGVSEPSLGTALSLSGAAITTEGFLAPKGVAETTLYIVAGVIGLGIVGLLITFLPT